MSKAKRVLPSMLTGARPAFQKQKQTLLQVSSGVSQRHVQKEPKREGVNGGGLPQHSFRKTEEGHRPRAIAILYVEHN
jgi:hypothetical protein